MLMPFLSLKQLYLLVMQIDAIVVYLQAFFEFFIIVKVLFGV